MKTTSICLALVLAAVLISGTYAYNCCVGSELGKCGNTVNCNMGGVLQLECYKWEDRKREDKPTQVKRGCDVAGASCTALKALSGGVCFTCNKEKCNSGVSVAAQISLISASAVMVIFTKVFL